jgi:aminobenzoyl-glutamate utilization protein B
MLRFHRVVTACIALAAAGPAVSAAPQDAPNPGAKPAKPDLFAPLTPLAPGWSVLNSQAVRSVDRLADKYVATSRAIFEHPETALCETKSSAQLAALAEEAGFKVERGVAQMPTAWVATWSSGAGGPTLGILAEFDALPNLSQQGGDPVQEPATQGAPGHGCGHNLFGVAALAAAVAMKEALQAEQRPATLKLYGTPAEEQGIGKIFMVRDGLFDGCDAVLSWHPSDKNEVHMQPSKACISFELTFYGRSAHASAAPWDGVSALDAVEAFEHGVNLLREHVPETARMHYVVSNGGGVPNVVPNKAAVWMFVRGKDWTEAQKVFAHVKGIADGADRMAWGEEFQSKAAGYRAPELVLLSGLYDLNINLAGSRIMQKELERVGVAAYDEKEQAYARALQKSFGMAEAGYPTQILPYDEGRAPEPSGSTDVGNVSWAAPVIELHVATWPSKIPAHSWASTSASGASGGFKAMLVAAKVLACTGLDLVADPAALASVKEEFKKSRAAFKYSPAVGPDDKPSLPSHLRAAKE